MATAISAINKALDFKTLSRIYNSNKIKYNPKNYSFKDKLIAIDLDKHTFKHISCVSRDAETFLENCLDTVGYDVKKASWNLNKYRGKDLVTQMTLEYPRLISGTPCFMKMGDLYFKPELYFRYKDLSTNSLPIHDEYLIDVSKMKCLEYDDTFNAILQLHIALTSTDSIAKHLIWLTSEYCDKPLRYVNEMKMVLDDLECNKLKALQFTFNESVMFAPVHDLKPKTRTDNFGEVGVTTTERLDSICNLMYITYVKCIIYGLEVLYAIHTIPNPKYVDILNELIRQNTGFVESLMFDKFLNPYPEVQNIIDCHNPEERYDLIRKFIIDKNIWVAFTSLVSSDIIVPAVPVAEWLLEACAFCNEYSTWEVRTKYLSILYKYCKDKGIFNNEDLDIEGIEEFESDLALTSSALGAPIGEGTMDGDTPLMDIPESHIPMRRGAPSGPTAEVSPTCEALDKLKASYTDDMYSFDVEDVVDTNPNNLYNAIAENTALLNKSLIKKIKEIKVYNAGGKNPGKSKGKLDRKALYKYKTCKDIFYDNTYKVKESDLAFGLILDVSGSMSGSGIKNGVATMIILHETLKALNINHSIITHTSDGRYHTDIKRYQAFKEDKTFSTLKNYALSNISACWGNCDSGALFYMEKALLRVKNKDKICIMFSDGEPTECSGTDLKDQVAKMERQGIKVIGVGINYVNIKKYYNEYANGKTLNEMFDIVADILKRYVLEKAE